MALPLFVKMGLGLPSDDTFFAITILALVIVVGVRSSSVLCGRGVFG